MLVFRLSSVTRLVASKRRGLAIGEALFVDGRVLRFRVTGIYPATVMLLPDEDLPEDQAAIERWITASRGDEAA